MPLETYDAAGLLFNTNFLSRTSDGRMAYRGELVLVEGGIGDAKGHAKPPLDVMRGVALLGGDKLELVVGAIDDLASLPVFVEKYKADFAADMLAVVFVVNIKYAVQVEVDGINFVLIPLVQGVPWNEIIDELALEKSDFKGQSSSDKVVTLLNELKGYKPTYPSTSLDEALANTVEVAREAWGAV